MSCKVPNLAKLIFSSFILKHICRYAFFLSAENENFEKPQQFVNLRTVPFKYGTFRALTYVLHLLSTVRLERTIQ